MRLLSDADEALLDARVSAMDLRTKVGQSTRITNTDEDKYVSQRML